MKATAELTNPYVAGRCWRKLSDSFRQINFCNGFPATKYRVTKKRLDRVGNLSVTMYLCAKCAEYMTKHGYELVNDR